MIVIRPHKMWSPGKDVSFPSIQDTYDPSWLVDNIPGRPVRCTGPTGAFTISGTAGLVDTLVLAHHNIWSPATVAVTGGITAAFTIPAARPNDIPYNPFIRLGSPVSVSTLTVTVTNNPSAFIIGEFIAGLSEEWDMLADDNSDTYKVFPLAEPAESEVSSVQMYRGGKEARVLSGSNFLTLAQQTFMEDWLAATHEGTRPSVVIKNADDNDARLVRVRLSIDTNQWRSSPREHKTGFAFEEYTRKRLP